jgi:hypothetical protein
MLYNIPVIKPAKSILYVWDIIHAMAILCCLFYMPIEMSTYTNFQDLYG